MDRSDRKRFTRKNLSLKIKKDRFISGYIEAKCPQVYNEAMKYYEQLDSAYPQKRDLTKTVEFLYLTTGVSSFSEYYHKKRLEKGKKQPEKEPSIVDNMVLKIPLFDPKDKNTLGSFPEQQEVSVHEAPLPIPDAVYENLLQELRNDPDLYAIFNDMNTSGDDIIDLSGEQQVCVTFEQPDEQHVTIEQPDEQPDESIPDTLCEDIVHELCEDPQLRDILDDMDIGEYNEQTPLERELSGLNY